MSYKGDTHSADPCAAHYGHPSAMLHMTVACIPKKIILRQLPTFCVRSFTSLIVVAVLPNDDLFYLLSEILLQICYQMSGTAVGAQAAPHFIMFSFCLFYWMVKCMFFLISLQQMILQRLWTLTALMCSNKLCNMIMYEIYRQFTHTPVGTFRTTWLFVVFTHIQFSMQPSDCSFVYFHLCFRNCRRNVDT